MELVNPTFVTTTSLSTPPIGIDCVIWKHDPASAIFMKLSLSKNVMLPLTACNCIVALFPGLTVMVVAVEPGYTVYIIDTCAVTDGPIGPVYPVYPVYPV